MKRTRDREATLAALKKAAADLFVANGYANVNVEQIGQRARVTTGAIYHHFRDKKALLQAVAEDTLERLMTAVQTAVPPEAEPLARLMAGVEAALERSAAPDVKLALLEAPAVLGRDEWSALEERHLAPLLGRNLGAWVASGALSPAQAPLLSRLLRGLLVEAAMAVAAASDAVAARAELTRMIRAMVGAVATR